MIALGVLVTLHELCDMMVIVTKFDIRYVLNCINVAYPALVDKKNLVLFALSCLQCQSESDTAASDCIRRV